jgi:hypothetical protein
MVGEKFLNFLWFGISSKVPIFRNFTQEKVSGATAHQISLETSVFQGFGHF